MRESSAASRFCCILFVAKRRWSAVHVRPGSGFALSRTSIDNGQSAAAARVWRRHHWSYNICWEILILPENNKIGISPICSVMHTSLSVLGSFSYGKKSPIWHSSTGRIYLGNSRERLENHLRTRDLSESKYHIEEVYYFGYVSSEQQSLAIQ